VRDQITEFDESCQ